MIFEYFHQLSWDPETHLGRVEVGSIEGLTSREIHTFDEFREARLNDKGFIVITDVVRPAIVHKLNGNCVSGEKFKVKVLLEKNHNGRYYWVDSVASAQLEHGASACKVCAPLRPERGIWKA